MGRRTSRTEGTTLRVFCVVITATLLASACQRGALEQAAEELPQAPGCRVMLSADVPAELINNVLLIEANANGQPVRVEVDTGSTGVAHFPPDVVRRLGLVPAVVPGRTVFTLAGEVQTSSVVLETLAVGDAVFRDTRVDVSALAQHVLGERRVDGLLNAGFLAGFDVEIDPSAGGFRLHTVRGCRDVLVPFDEPYAAVKLQRGPGGLVFLPMRINGETLLGLIDTGATSTVVTEAATRRLGLTPADLAGDLTVQSADGFGNTISARIHRFREIEIGEHIFRNVALPVVDSDLEITDVVIGMDFLPRQRIWISYATSQLFMGRQPAIER